MNKRGHHELGLMPYYVTVTGLVGVVGIYLRKLFFGNVVGR